MEFHNVFVYGTLRRGQPLHGAMHGDFKGVDSIHAQLVGHVGVIPMIIPHESKTVTGELFEVDDDALAVLNHIEGVYQGLYRRERVTTLGGVEAFVYFPNATILNGMRAEDPNAV